MEGYEDIELQDFNAPEEREDDVEDYATSTTSFDNPAFDPGNAGGYIEDDLSVLLSPTLQISPNGRVMRNFHHGLKKKT